MTQSVPPKPIKGDQHIKYHQTKYYFLVTFRQFSSFMLGVHNNLKLESLLALLNIIEEQCMGSDFSQLYECYVKCKQLPSGFELELPCSFPVMHTGFRLFTVSVVPK